jgi:ATP-dependent DNA helicase RecQ
MPAHPAAKPLSEPDDAPLRRALREHWGYDEFRPLQLEAMRAVLANRDSVVVLPTGGGKSLCFQVPAVVKPGLAIIVSPLISLMKDQVDTLRECGIAAAAVNSSMSADERRKIADDIRAGTLRILYAAPERLCSDRMLDFLEQVPISLIAIDEAHCISAWGHDFRPEFRILGQLRSRFPGVAMHAYTATATQAVRDDIATQLHQRDPLMLVGGFDRPNLGYYVERKTRVGDQIREVLSRRQGESGIVYAFSRKEVDSLAAELRSEGYSTVPYHAGLSDSERMRNQEDFLNERVDIVVATVAFGMGIDKPNVRFVVHTHAPQSLEHYQQETGRAGRDGLPSECRMFYGDGDFITWKKMKGDLDEEAMRRFNVNLRAMEQYCRSISCRHRSLVEYFGQELGGTNCGACDSCLDEVEVAPDSLITAQKILSCVVRVKERFGGEYVAQVLLGANVARILENGHQQLSTFGLLKGHDRHAVRGWIDELLGQGFLEKEGEYNVLTVTPSGRDLLKGNAVPRLSTALAKETKKPSKSRESKVLTEGVDSGLFETLRQLRKEIATEKKLPPYMIFGDATLAGLAAIRPDSIEGFQQVPGIGATKARQYGERFLAAIVAYCSDRGLATNEMETAKPTRAVPIRSRASSEEGMTGQERRGGSQLAANELFAEGRSVDEVAERMGRALSTVWGYLQSFFTDSDRTDPRPWVELAILEQVRTAMAAGNLPPDRLAPIFEACGGTVPYNELRICVQCLRNEAGASEESGG